MSSLRLFLFGAPRLEREDRPLALHRTKALALLAYLAVTRRPHDRDTLIGLLWPEFATAAARNNLRRELSMLKGMLDPDALQTEGRQIALHPHAAVWVDVAAFEDCVAQARQHNHASETLCPQCVAWLGDAAALYSGEFMAGFGLADCFEFESWLFFQREERRQRLSDVLQALVRHGIATNEYSTALPYARRWLALDVLHEPAHRTLMRLYSLDNQHTAALRQYEECRRVLDQELGVEPDQETTDLYEAIRTRRFEGHAPQTAYTQTPHHRAPKEAELPAFVTPLVGRRRELEELEHLISTPACRLLTITGPGGIGKTRLAVALAQQLREGSGANGYDDIIFVPLAAVFAPSGIVAAIAKAVGFAFYSDVPPQRQLLDYLGGKRLVLVLDNVEHLLTGVDLFLDILATAPTIRLVVTSRERLNVQEEWVYAIGGLVVHDALAADPSVHAHDDAVQLFALCARRVQPRFMLEHERASVVRICEQVEGMPLAIELAAAWCATLPCSTIAHEIASNLDFLSSRLRDAPERHRSVRAVFEHSWNLLAPPERAALEGVSIIEGSWKRATAEAVAGASLPVLARLVEQSLLRATGERYTMHELLRQFVGEKLRADPRHHVELRERHSTYFLGFLTEQGAHLQGSRQREALASIGDEIENIRAAWKWVIDGGNVDLVERSLDTLYDFFHICSRYQEGEETLRYVIEHLRLDDAARQTILHHKVYARLGALWAVLGQLRPAKQRLGESVAFARERNDRREIAFALNALGELAMWQGRYAAAQESLEESLRVAREIDDVSGQEKTLFRLADLAQHVGRYADGKRLAQESLAISRLFGRQNRIAYGLVMQGFCCFCSGEWEEAEWSVRESADIFEAIGDQIGLAIALGAWGWVGAVHGRLDADEARTLGERSVALAREVGNRYHLAIRLSVHAEILRAIGAIPEAAQVYVEGLGLARTVDARLPLLMCLRGLGDVALHNGEWARTRQYLLQALLSAFVPAVLPGALATLVSFAALLMGEGEAPEQEHTRQTWQEQALELLVFAQLHPLCWKTWFNRAVELERKLVPMLPPPTVTAIRLRARQHTLEDVVSALLRQHMIDPLGAPDLVPH
jgi:DNA-binding SARP family transcriptional activator/predicted ATPase